MGNSQSSGVSSGDGGKNNYNSNYLNSSNLPLVTIKPETKNSSGYSEWNNSTSNSGYSGGSSYSSQEQHIQSVNTALGGNVLGGAYNDQRKKRDMDDGINYQVKGIVQNLNYYGFKDPKGIVLSDCALEDKDIGVLVQSLQPHPFNLTILDLSFNKLGYYSVENIFYGMRGSQEGVTTHVCKQIKSINFSNNLLDDNSANYIAKSLEYGRFPSLKYLDVSGNNITVTGTGYITNALNVISQDLKIVLGSLKGIAKDIFKPSIKAMLYLAKSNGIQTKDALTTQETIEHCKKGSLNVVSNLAYGVLKCYTNADKPIAIYEMDFQTLGVNVLTNIFNPLKKPTQFICMSENTIFSVVDEEFANCLTGLDSGFE